MTTSKKKTPKKQKAQAKRSGTGPVAQVWAIAEKFGPKAVRKEVLAACAKAGINPATAATQWYRYQHRNDKQGEPDRVMTASGTSI
jgi:hypothetical protein